MEISIKKTQPSTQFKTCLMLGVFEDGSLTPTAKIVDQACGHYITKLLKKAVFKGKIGTTLPVFNPESSAKFEQMLLVGCGPSNKLGLAVFRRIVLSAMRALNTFRVDKVTCYLTELDVEKESLPWKVKQITEITLEAMYSFDEYKTEKNPIALKELIIHVSENESLKACEEGLKQGQAIANGMTLTKNLANTPSNICTPTYLAKAAQKLAKDYRSIKVEVLEESDMKKLGMGALLGVAQGSAEPPKLITLIYSGTTKKTTQVALVGKGVTFDTGGNSLKSADNMVGMKYDMCGAATVLGVIKAAADLKLPINIVGVIPAVENMPGGDAYKPEDILKSLSGQTIEVISTDAEGRLILADALTYCERYKPEVVIDIATLTGAVVIALGFQATGLIANDETLAKELLKAGLESNDRAWQLPLWDEYQDNLRSPFADMTNSGGRPAGAILAGCFLSRFTKSYRWAHLDVAGTAAMMMGTSERMATGRPIPLLMQYLINQVS